MKVLTHGIVNRKSGVFGYSGWPSVCRDENDVLYAVASSLRLGHVCPFGKTALYISRDRGATWAPPVIINDSYMDDRDAGILYLGNGRLLVTWFCHPIANREGTYLRAADRMENETEAALARALLAGYDGFPAEETRGGSYVMQSYDYGVTWTEPVRIPVNCPHGPVQAPDGTLLYLGKVLFEKEDAGELCLYTSRDGTAWEKRSVLPHPDELTTDQFHEPHILPLPDGTLLGAIRVHLTRDDGGLRVYTTRSSDNGLTWSDWTDTGVCGTPPHLMRHSSGKLVLTYARRIEPYGIRVITSDDGVIWSEEAVLDGSSCDPDMGYPCTAEMSDGELVTVYYQKYGSDRKCSLLYTRWTI